jgi:RNA polymerase sigma factor (TIGR02999 family)
LSKTGKLDTHITIRRIRTTSAATLMSRFRQMQGCPSPQRCHPPAPDWQQAEEVQDLRPGGGYTHGWPRIAGNNGWLKTLNVQGRQRFRNPGQEFAEDVLLTRSSHSVSPMNEVTRILSAIDQGDPNAAAELLPLVYDELRQLATHKLAHEKPDHTLQATALVHEAYLRLVEVEQAPGWHSRGHFFAAAAEAMRRILIDQARHKQSQRQGGGRKRQPLEHVDIAAPEASVDVLALDEALERFAQVDRLKADLVKLRYFAGLTIPQAAEALGISATTADRYWAYARAWLHAELKKGG